MPNIIPCDRPCVGTRCLLMEHKGKIYRCAHILAKEYGCTRQAVYQTLERNGHTDNLGLKGGRGNQKRKVTCGPHTWPSVTAMALDLDVKRRTLAHHLDHNPERVLALVMQKKSA